MNQDISYDIISERLNFAIDAVKKEIKKHELKVSDYEMLDIATRIALSLYIARERYNERKR